MIYNSMNLTLSSPSNGLIVVLSLTSGVISVRASILLLIKTLEDNFNDRVEIDRNPL